MLCSEHLMRVLEVKYGIFIVVRMKFILPTINEILTIFIQFLWRAEQVMDI